MLHCIPSLKYCFYSNLSLRIQILYAIKSAEVLYTFLSAAHLHYFLYLGVLQVLNHGVQIITY